MSIAEKMKARATDAAEMVEAQRKNLAQVAEGNLIGDLANVVNQIAQAEGACSVWSKLQRVAESKGEDFTKELADKVLVSVLSQGADDGWSGRTNDAQRAYFDGVRNAASEVGFEF